MAIPGAIKMREPAGIDEHLDQLRPPVVRAKGTTQSERHLAKLADRSFLNLWSYPSPFRNQKQSGNGDGKELCDLLVVCGNIIIIFSEKTITWPGGDVALAWSRWARRAIAESAKQAKGAERWITEHSDRIFLDRGCTVPFPIDFPTSAERTIHRVIVARGASDECQKHQGGNSGSFVIKPAIKGVAHWLAAAEPFAVGDIDPSSSFVHVFDEVALDLVMEELDTIHDFATYLDKRAAFIRSGRLSEAHGEENLLAYYAVRINEAGEHDFVLVGDQNAVEIDRNHHKRLVGDARYIAKKRADEISYLWDALIEGFTTHMLGGTSVVPAGYDFDLKKSELGVRHMALQSRFARRCHSEAIAGALEIGKTKDRFFRSMIGNAGPKESGTAFFILTMKYLDWMDARGGYEHYRKKRAELATVYARGLLERYSNLKSVVGISREPPDQGRGISEDLICATQVDWSQEERQAIREDCKSYGALQDQLKASHRHSDEFPELNDISLGRMFVRPVFSAQGNRKQRRRLAAKARKKTD